MPQVSARHRLRETNRRFYDRLWSDTRLVGPERFNSWGLVSRLAAQAPRRLEVAPGMRPRLPIEGSCFVELSLPPLERLRAAGGGAVCGLVTEIPLADASFDLVCAFDIVEHVDDDAAAFAELARVAAPGAILLISVPLHPQAWTPFDALVGHCRRYEPQSLLERLGAAGLVVRQSAVFGMQPRSSRMVRLGMWFLERDRARAMWWYNRIFMPLALRLAKPLVLQDGVGSTEGVDTMLLVCRKAGSPDDGMSR